MTSSLAPSPAAGYPAYGNQAPHPQSTAVAATAASNGVGNPYVQFTPASAAPSTCQSLRKALGRCSKALEDGTRKAAGTTGSIWNHLQTAPNKPDAAVVRQALGRYGKALEDGTRKAADTTGNIWNHLRTAPNIADAAVARLAQGTKVYGEGGHDRVFHQVFGAVPGEQLLKAYACYLSTTSDPVIGTLYLSTARLAFCSDSPLPYQGATAQPPEPMYYKVVVPLNQVRSVNASIRSRSERYIQITTTDGYEFWFMGFVSYDNAFNDLSEALQRQSDDYTSEDDSDYEG